MKFFGRRKEPDRRRAVQFPEGGFEHPFQDPGDYRMRYRAEHPRTVGVGSIIPASFRHIAPPGRRVADVCALQSHSGKTQLVGGGEG